jgi:hypothetical protein
MKPFDSMLQFPTTRARLYPHGPTGDGSYDEPIVDLAVDHLAVDVSVIDLGLVTIAASTRNKLVDGYGFEFDLDASDADALGRQLIAAAAKADRAIPPPDSDVDLIVDSSEAAAEGPLPTASQTPGGRWSDRPGCRAAQGSVK